MFYFCKSIKKIMLFKLVKLPFGLCLECNLWLLFCKLLRGGCLGEPKKLKIEKILVEYKQFKKQKISAK